MKPVHVLTEEVRMIAQVLVDRRYSKEIAAALGKEFGTYKMLLDEDPKSVHAHIQFVIDPARRTEFVLVHDTMGDLHKHRGKLIFLTAVN